MAKCRLDDVDELSSLGPLSWGGKESGDWRWRVNAMALSADDEFDGNHHLEPSSARVGMKVRLV